VSTEQIRPGVVPASPPAALKDSSVLVAGGTDTTTGEDGTLPLASAELTGR